MIRFSGVMAFEHVEDDPTALNSNLLPVNANGDVLFLSVLSNKISGIFGIFRFRSKLLSFATVPKLSSSLITLVSWVPINAEIIAGGASLAPSRWSFEAEAIEDRIKSAWV